MLHVVAESEDRLPSGDRVGSYYWMHRDQLFAHVFRGTSWLGIDFESVLFGCLVEFGLCVGCRQAFEELLDRG